jgi:hypothetical protein
MCVQCRCTLCTGIGLDVTDADDLYVVELITQMQLDMYRHLTPATVRGYAREVNLLADFAAALPGLDKSDIISMVEFDEDSTRVSAVHAIAPVALLGAQESVIGVWY